MYNWNKSCNLGLSPENDFAVIWSDGIHLKIEGPQETLSCLVESNGKINENSFQNNIGIINLYKNLEKLGVFMTDQKPQILERITIDNVTFIKNKYSEIANKIASITADIISAECRSRITELTPDYFLGDTEIIENQALFIAIGLKPADFYKINKMLSNKKINWLFVYSPSSQIVTISNLIDYKHGCYKCFRALHVGSIPDDHLPLAADIERWIEKDLINIRPLNDISIEQNENQILTIIATLITFVAKQRLVDVVHTLSFDEAGMEINRSATITLPGCDCCE